MKSHYYAQHAGGAEGRAGRGAPREQLRELAPQVAVAAPRRRRAAVRASSGLATWALIRFANPLIWIPLALVQGFTVFNFTVLLHEVVHHTVFETRHPAPSGCSACSTRCRAASRRASSRAGTWIITPSSDPTRTIPSGIICRRRSTRAGTSCSTRRRRCFRSISARPGASRRPIRQSCSATIALRAPRRHGVPPDGALRCIWWTFGAAARSGRSIIPVFFVFPIAFTLNRLGQHYDIDPTDPAKWGTLMRSHWFWDFAFLNSNYHLEHHYFPGVPFYRLPGAAARAAAVLRAEAACAGRATGPVYGWIVENQAPHTDWSLAVVELERD